MSQSPLSSQLDAERTGLLERAAGSVLAVETQRMRQSAFVWRGGLLVTAAEPLEGAELVRILKDGSTSDAEVLACDLRTDIAVLRVAETPGPPLAPAASTPRPGQLILVAGRARAHLSASFGSLQLSTGPWTTRRGATLSHRLLLDVHLAPCAEGAPVLDLEGGVLAMAVRGPANQVIGIPADAIDAAVSEVAAHGRIAQGYLGLRVVPLALGLQARHRLDAGRAVLIVADVAQPSPAFDAGLEIGDLLLAVDGEAVQGPDRLLGRIQGKRPGESMLLKRRRGTAIDEVPVTVGSRP
jgi:S1-C subfamily serine protease